VLRLTLKNLWAYKKRLLTSGLSIVIGISFLAGSFVFTDTLKGLFTDLFKSSVEGVDAQVRQERVFGSDTDGGPYDTGRAGLPSSLATDIRAVPGVRAVAPYIEGYAQPINAKGKLVKTGGAPTFGYTWVADPEISAYRLLNGRAPNADGEVVFDRGLMKETKAKIGDTVRVNTLVGVQEFRLVGDATFGTSDAALGITAVFFSQNDAQKYLLRPGFVQSFLIRADAGVDEATVAKRIESALAGKDFDNKTQIEVLTGTELEEEQLSFVNTIFGFINTFFTAFAVVALFVSIFVISNSFSILVTQRTREMASMRILGASRAQVLTTTFLEALAVGLLASAVGVAAGLGVAQLIRLLLETFFGGGLPSSGLVLKPRTIAVGMGVGTVVTVLSAILPALKSARVKPLAALRETAIDHAGTSKPRLIFGGVLTSIAGAVMAAGLADSGSDGALKIGIAAGVALLAIALLGPVLAKPVAGALGRPWFGVIVAIFGGLLALFGTVGLLVLGGKQIADGDLAVGRQVGVGVVSAVVAFAIAWLIARRRDRGRSALEDPTFGGTRNIVLLAGLLGLYNFSPFFGGAVVAAVCGWYLIRTGRSSFETSGQIARENAIRNPTRTSATALALTIGTALVSALSVLSFSLTDTFRGVFDETIVADHVVASTAQDVGFPISVQERIDKVPGVEASSTLQFARFRFGFPARERTIGGIESADFEKVVRLGDVEGSMTALAKPDTIAVAKTTAKDQGLKLGDTIKSKFGNGRDATFSIVAFYGNAEGLGNTYYLVDNSTTLSKYIENPSADLLYVKSSAKTKDQMAELEAAADEALAEYPGAEFQTKKKFVDGQVGQFQQFLAIVNALLFLAIIIAVLGIANTLRLSIFERTREIGLLRAVGMSRDQLRSSIRWEAIVVATFGAVVGVVFGTVFGSALVHVLGKDDGLLKLSVPVQILFPLALLASIVGLYAARKPATDAARLNILQAISTE
jgi:putative ABC transport system permease protein